MFSTRITKNNKFTVVLHQLGENSLLEIALIGRVLSTEDRMNYNSCVLSTEDEHQLLQC